MAQVPSQMRDARFTRPILVSPVVSRALDYLRPRAPPSPQLSGNRWTLHHTIQPCLSTTGDVTTVFAENLIFGSFRCLVCALRPVAAACVVQTLDENTSV